MQLVYILLAAGAYYLAGRLGLLLAIPPGFASAVWPAAGIGLACALLLSRQAACAGAAIGSFFLNLGVISQGFTEVNAAMLPLPTAIATGAAIQVWVGHGLYLRLIGTHLCIDTPRQIGSFLALISPLGCLVGASVGTTGLLFKGFIEPSQLGFTWFTWWLGDTIGVMLFAPLLLTLAAKDTRLTPLRRVSIATPIAVIFTAVTLLFVWSSGNRAEQDAKYIDTESAEIFEDAEARLQIASNLLNAFDAALADAGNLTQAQFDQMASILLTEADWVKAVSWVPIVPQSERKAFEELMQRHTHENFTLVEIGGAQALVPASEQHTYYPVQFIYPQQGNERAIGLNLGANGSRLKALENAHALRRPVATEPIQLVQSEQTVPAMILYKPIYQRALEQVSAQHPIFSRTKLHGYISGVFTFPKLFGDLFESAAHKQLSVSLEDLTEPAKPQILITNSEPALAGYTPLTYATHFGERVYRFTFTPSNAFASSAKDWSSWNILTFGFLLAALFQGFILLLTGHTKSVEAEVARQTKLLQHAKEQAESASRAKTRFLANMSHELRTPLHAVTGLLAMSLKTPLNAQQQHYLNKAQVAASALVALINQTIDYSKIEAGKLSLKHEAFSIKTLLHRVHTIFTVEAEAKGISLSFHLPQQVPEHFIGDSLRIEQVLTNLLGNAVKFTEQGRVDFSLSIELDETPHTCAKLAFEITDTGIGISQENTETLFEAFQQGDSSNTRKFGGTGLGLSICKKLAETMQGSLAISSQAGQGTCARFSIALPVENPEATVNLQLTPSQTKSALAQLPEIDATFLQGHSVLIVEDIEINQEIARFMLEDHGAEVCVANNGREALDILSNKPGFDLILMDIQMPEMDGLEATRRIRELNDVNHIPIVAMTANAIKGDIHDCMAAGMNAHVAKPIDEQDLMTKIHQCLLGNRASNANA
ncbi:CHASE domain-containing protein [Simiduia sp. 21SJ11W-1]|uniref:CHASE domain-containing protein n=1 Tax=Simiduia sp. 21SJ11W-1 TaxID=2909669 RepID=UPI00209F47BE|nr:CHASE domain-containing protein [Simiduia sp. 21SJ11W-1]UTA47080.1 CHASE domain-containing protein [Simiduia sp. 21SJ11W-1]